MQSSLVLLTLFAIVVIAFLVGNYVARSYRMPETGWKVSLILAVLGFAGVILWTSWPPKQGIDLKGGVILIYEVDEDLTAQAARQRQTAGTEQAPKSDEEAAQELAEDEVDRFGQIDMPALIQALSRRINPGGVQEIVVRRYGDNQVEIIIPDVSSQEVERVKKLITTGGFLKFMIVANERDHGHLFDLADDPDQAGQYELRDDQGDVVAQWVKLSLDPEADQSQGPVYRVEPPGSKTRMVRGRKEILMQVDPNLNLQGKHLASVRKGFKDLSPIVEFSMNAEGAGLMGVLTASNLPDTTSGHYSLLGIVMDGELISAPRINDTITSSGIIEGRFTDEEVDMLVNVLRAGRLPAVLREDPISQNEISPLLGKDTIRQGKISIGVSLVAVLAFMLFYYRFAGIVACLALVANLVLILALMIFVGAAFSLPGMAGLVLTVGMSVDANVLIFERMREEMRNGAALRMAIRNGFGRATRTIVDANVTTLITAIVLYLIGNEQLRAFAVTLILGILMCLFTAIFCSRVVFDIAERRRWLKKLSMMQMFASPNLNLFGMRRAAIAFSILVMAIGIGAVAARGRQIFDIDFLGGTSVQVLLRKDHAMPIAEVRKLADQLRENPLTKDLIQDISVTGVTSEEHGSNRIYRIDTSLRKPEDATEQKGTYTANIAHVQNALKEIFRDAQGNLMLQTHSMSFTSPTAPEMDAPPETSAPAADAPFLPMETDETSSSDETQAEVEASGFGQEESETEPSEATGLEESPTDSAGTDDSSSDATTPNDDQGANNATLDGTLLAFAGDELLAQLDEETAASAAVDEPIVPSTSNQGSTATEPAADGTIPMQAAAPVASDASILRSQSEIALGSQEQEDEKLNAETLEELIKETADRLNLTEPDVVLSNPAWDGSSSHPYANWTVKLSNPPAEAQQILDALQNQLNSTPVWLAADQIGSSVALNKTNQALVAIGASLLGIIAYLWIRFQHVVYGVAAVVAVVHDVVVTIGAIALSYWLAGVLGFLQVEEFKISLPVVAAILTIIGYSLNDTIVIFDRIREIKGKSPQLTVSMINDSINQTLSRTILTSLTTLIVVVILYAIGGPGIHAFAFALIVGVVAGTYSTVFIASPVLLWFSGSKAASTKPVAEKVPATS